MTTWERLLNVLGLFTTARPEWTVEGAAKELGLTVSTTYRYFKGLSGAGFISAYLPGRYVLGPAFIQYDRQIRLLDPLINTAAPAMEHLAVTLPPQTVVLLCRLYRTQVMCVDQRLTERVDFAVSYERGRPMPLYRGAPSKVILANLESRIVKSLYARDATEMKEAGLGDTWDTVKQTLRAIRVAGVFATEGEIHRGMQGISAAIFSPEGMVIGSVSAVASVRNRNRMPVAAVAELLTGAVHDIEAGLKLLSTSHRPAPAIESHAAAGQTADQQSGAPAIRRSRPSRSRRRRPPSVAPRSS